MSVCSGKFAKLFLVFQRPPPMGQKGPTCKLTRPMRSERGGAGEKPAGWFQVLLRSMSSWLVASLPLSLGDAGGCREACREERDVRRAEGRREVWLRRGHRRQRGRRSRGRSGGAPAGRGAASNRWRLFFVLSKKSGHCCFCILPRHSSMGCNYGRGAESFVRKCLMGLYQAWRPCKKFPAGWKISNIVDSSAPSKYQICVIPTSEVKLKSKKKSD